MTDITVNALRHLVDKHGDAIINLTFVDFYWLEGNSLRFTFEHGPERTCEFETRDQVLRLAQTIEREQNFVRVDGEGATALFVHPARLVMIEYERPNLVATIQRRGHTTMTTVQVPARSDKDAADGMARALRNQQRSS